MKMVVAVVCSILVVAVSAKDLKTKDVPSQVRSALKTTFVQAEDIEWETEGDGYGATFEMDDIEMSVVFDSDGKVLEKETHIRISELPGEALQQLQSRYSDSRFKEVVRIQKEGETTYEVDVIRKTEVTLDSYGTIIGENRDGDAHEENDDDSDDDDD